MRELDLKSFHAVNHIQSMAIDLEDARAVVIASTGPGETTGKGRAAATTHEVRAHAAMYF